MTDTQTCHRQHSRLFYTVLLVGGIKAVLHEILLELGCQLVAQGRALGLQLITLANCAATLAMALHQGESRKPEDASVWLDR